MGYNIDDKDLPQINLCLLFGQSFELPIYQTIYNGSLTDVSTLFCTLDELIYLTKGTKYILTVDKDLFSEPNIDILVKEDIGSGFLIGAPFTNNLVTNLVDKYRLIDNDQRLLVSSSDNNLYGITENIVFGQQKHNLYAHIYYNPVKFMSERHKLLNDLTKLQKLIAEGKKINTYNKTQILKYFDINIKNGVIEPKIYNLMFDETLKFAGWHVLFSNKIDNLEKANKIYRHKDVIKKSFNSLKNRLSLNRIREYNYEKMENKLFISFISLIITSFIHKRLRDNGFYKSNTMDKILEKIELMKKTRINSNTVYKPLTKEIKSTWV
jgi:transposase